MIEPQCFYNIKDKEWEKNKEYKIKGKALIKNRKSQKNVVG